MERKSSRPIELFYCYAHEDRALRDELDNHLAPLRRTGLITAWYDGEILFGSPWEEEIEAHLNTARMILLLVSPHFLASDYCYCKEMTRAIERHWAKDAYVIPVLLRPVDWTNTPFRILRMSPSGARPVTSWPNRDEAWLDVVQGINKIIKELQREQHPSPPDIPLGLTVRKKKGTAIITSILAILLIISGTTYYINNHLTPSISLIPNGPPVWSDPLNNQANPHHWDLGSQGGGVTCQFEGASYHLSAPKNSGGWGCSPEEDSAKHFTTNFTYRITMVINHNSSGDLSTGPTFCQANGSYYSVSFNAQGDWDFGMYDPGHTPIDTHITAGHSQFFQTGIGQINYITVQVTKAYQIDAQVNGKALFPSMVLPVNERLSGGQIGVVLSPGEETADVAFNDAKVWQF